MGKDKLIKFKLEMLKAPFYTTTVKLKKSSLNSQCTNWRPSKGQADSMISELPRNQVQPVQKEDSKVRQLFMNQNRTSVLANIESYQITVLRIL